MSRRQRTPRLRAVVLLVAALTLTGFVTFAHDLTGTWDFSVVTENGTGTPVIKITQAGEKLTGTYTSRMMGERNITGSVKGDSMRFVLSNTASPEAVTMTFLGVILDKDRVKGEVDFGGMGGASFTGLRRPTP